MGKKNRSMPAGYPDGTKFKEYEAEALQTLPEKTYAVIRFDGVSFSRFTKQFEFPYSYRFMDAMDDTAKGLCKFIPGAVAGYVQSDEISIIFSDLANKNTQMWFAGKTTKMLSIGAAAATAVFQRELGNYEGLPMFDARVHTLNGFEEVEQYIRWRRADAQKNSITMAVSTKLSHRELEGMPTSQRHAMLQGTDYEVLPDGFFNGRIARKNVREVRVPGSQGETFFNTTWETVDATRDYMETEFAALEVPAFD